MFFADSTSLINGTTATVAAVFALVAAIVIAFVFRSQWVKTTMETQNASIEALTTANEGLRTALSDERRERQLEHVACAEKIGNLQGQITALSGDIGQVIAKSAVSAVLAALHETGALSKKES